MITRRHLLTALLLALLLHAGVALWFMTLMDTPKTELKTAPPTVTITLSRAMPASNTAEPLINTAPIQQETKPIIKSTERVQATPVRKPETKATVNPDIKPTPKPAPPLAVTPENKPKTAPIPKANLTPQEIIPPMSEEAKQESMPVIQTASPPSPSFTDEDANQYQQQLSAWLNQYKTYPKRAKRMRIEGEGVLTIQIDRTGVVQTVKLTQSTGNRLLDKAALNTAQNASPFPAMAPNDPRQSMVFEVPISFLLH